jgi:uncharacterized membrane protein YhiD involved in acid resistance
MKDFIIDNFKNIVTLDFKIVAINNLAAIGISLFILLIYRITYSGTSYSKKFNVSLGMMTIVTALIMNVISNNIALSLGMVGALSIIRFRTAVKDVRDATFIFWSIAVGICCGVSQYLPAAIGSAAIALFLLVMRQTGKSENYLIIVRSTLEAQGKAEAAVDKYFSRAAHLRVRNTTKEFGDLIYEVSGHEVRKASKKLRASISEKLISIDGVISVDQVEQSDDISL